MATKSNDSGMATDGGKLGTSLNHFDPYVVHIFVKDGDPEGIRIIDQVNWTGQAIVFPRERWGAAKGSKEFDRPGIYILHGFADHEEGPGRELPTIYIGEGDGIRNRIETHVQSKAFWTTCIAFVAKDGSLHKAHIQWLEANLIRLASKARSCILDNANAPVEPALADSEQAGMRVFLREMLKILPIAGLHVFHERKRTAPTKTQPNASTVPVSSAPVSAAQAQKPLPQVNEKAPDSDIDTIVVPTPPGEFNRVFVGEKRWFPVRMAIDKIHKIKWIAAYQSHPTKAITHIAPIARIEPHSEQGRHTIILAELPAPITPVPLGDADGGFFQGPRYTSRSRLLSAKSVLDLADK